jgi:hypothetical protein
MAKLLNIDELKVVPKDKIAELSKALTSNDIKFLVETLSEKDDKIRYNAFLLLQAHSREQPSVYQYWDVLEGKLASENSYQRSLGVMLLSENVRWDKENKFGGVLGKYLACCSDEKFITARQAIQALATVVKSTDRYNDAIVEGLSNLQLSKYKENQLNLLKKDAANVLKAIKRK